MFRARHNRTSSNERLKGLAIQIAMKTFSVEEEILARSREKQGLKEALNKVARIENLAINRPIFEESFCQKLLKLC